MKSKKRQISFAGTIILSFLVYSVVVSIVFFSTSHFIEGKRTKLLPSIKEFVEYEKYMVKEEYERIPNGLLQNGAIAVFDDDGNVLYTSDNEIAGRLEGNDISLISDFYADTYYDVVNNEDGTKLIMLVEFDFDKDDYIFTAYSRIGEDGRVLEGDLFEEGDYLTENELQFLCGRLSGDEYLERLTFETEAGEGRSLVFYSKMMTASEYRDVEKALRIHWIPAFLILIGCIIIFALSLAQKTRKLLEPIDEAMNAYGKGKHAEFLTDQVPREFQYVAETFEKMQKRVDETKEKEREMFEERERVFAALTHDIKTPLTVIGGYSNAIRDNLVSEEQKKKYMEIISKKVEDLSHMTEMLLEYSKTSHPDMEISLKRMDICENLRRYLAEVYVEVETAGYQLDIEIPDTPLYAMVDEKMFVRVFENLLSNAMKYNDIGTKIMVCLQKEDQKACLYFADDGVGIPEEIRKKLFKPFVIGNQARTGGTSTGLGLSIAESAVALHGGTIELVEQPEAGYTTEYRIAVDIVP